MESTILSISVSERLLPLSGFSRSLVMIFSVNFLAVCDASAGVFLIEAGSLGKRFSIIFFNRWFDVVVDSFLSKKLSMSFACFRA